MMLKPVHSVLLVSLFAFSADGGDLIRALTPVPRTNAWWTARHAQKLAAVAAEPARWQVVLLGDNGFHDWESGYVASWKKWFGFSGPYHVLNLGFRGDRTENVLWRIDNGELDRCSAKAVAVMVGADNVGDTAIDVLLGVRAVLDRVRIKQPKAEVILFALPPRGTAPDDPVRLRNAAVNRELCRFADGHRVHWVDLTDRMLDMRGRLSRTMLPDGVNFGEYARDVLASALVPYLNRAVASPGSALAFPSVYPQRPSEVPDEPREALPDTRTGLNAKDREDGPFGDFWWLNRLHNRRRQIEGLKGATVDLALVGDSITHFWEWKHPASWAALTNRCSAINLGYGGDRTQDALWRVTNGELDGYRARVVMVLIGTNNNSAEDSRPEDVARGVQRVLETVRAKQPQAKVILLPLLPRGSKAEWTVKYHAAAHRRNLATNPLLKRLADGKTVFWLDFNDKLVDADGLVPYDLMNDAIHPTDAGYRIWMDALFPLLDGLPDGGLGRDGVHRRAPFLLRRKIWYNHSHVKLPMVVDLCGCGADAP